MKRFIAAAWLAGLLAACAGYQPQAVRPGQSEAEVMQLMGQPTGRYPMPGGATRLEYATGPYGRFTWMVDLDAAGRVSGIAQVLNEQSFAALQQRYRTMDADELRRTLGRPAYVRGGGWQGGWVWSWRYPTNECFWYQVSILDSGMLRDGGTYGIDPSCDPGSLPSRK